MDMARGTRLGPLLETSNTLNILLYVRNHPMCMKTDVYKNVSRSVHIPAKIDELERLGLISFCQIPGSIATHLVLTDKGIRFTDLLPEAESLLNDHE